MDSPPSAKPSGAVIEIGNKCNLNCLSCETQKSKRPHEEMDCELFEKVVDMYLEMGFKTIWLHTNNEPLFNKNIIELCHILNDRRLNIHISTNGMLVRSFIDEYVKAGLDIALLDFRYSIDGGNKETFERLRRGASFPVLMEGLQHLTCIYKQQGRKAKLSVNYNLSKDTLKEVPEFMDKFSSYFGRKFLYPNYTFRLLDTRGVYKKKEYVNKLWDKEHLKYPVVNAPCWQPFRTFATLYDGRVTGCCGDYDGDLVVGDVHDSSIKEIWNNSQMNKLRNAHINKDLTEFPKCRRCFRPSYTLMRAVDAYIRAVALPKNMSDGDLLEKDVKSFISKIVPKLNKTKLV